MVQYQYLVTTCENDDDDNDDVILLLPGTMFINVILSTHTVELS